MSRAGFRLGYVDNNLNNFHANVYLKLLRGDLASRGFTVTAGFGLQAQPSREWAAANNVPYFDDAAAMDREVDGYVVLAPSDPQTHLPLVQRVIGFGKPIFVDKPFAQDLSTAQQLFALADKHNVAMQSASALRSTPIQQRVRELGPAKLRHIVTWGGGRSFEEYGIHPTELAISCMGSDVQRLACRRQGDFWQLLLDFANGRTATIHVVCNNRLPFSATLVFDDVTEQFTVDSGILFRDAAGAILDFFAAGKAQIDRRETLLIRRILDAAEQAAKSDGYVTLA